MGVSEIIQSTYLVKKKDGAFWAMRPGWRENRPVQVMACLSSPSILEILEAKKYAIRRTGCP
jgi:hypothetical protein